MSTCIHRIASSDALPYDGMHHGPAAGGCMHLLWCVHPGCTWACKDYASAGYVARVRCTHPRVMAERAAAAKHAFVAALPPVMCIDRGAVRGTIRVLDVTGDDAAGSTLIRAVVVESTWGGLQAIGLDIVLATMAAQIPGISAVYAEVLRQAQVLASKPWTR